MPLKYNDKLLLLTFYFFLNKYNCIWDMFYFIIKIFKNFLSRMWLDEFLYNTLLNIIHV